MEGHLDGETEGNTPMASEFDFLQVGARLRQNELLAEAAARRLARTADVRREDLPPAGRRLQTLLRGLQTLLRRIAGAPTFA